MYKLAQFYRSRFFHYIMMVNWSLLIISIFTFVYTDNLKISGWIVFLTFLFLFPLWAEQFFVRFELKDKIAFHLANQNENFLAIPFVGASLWRIDFIDKSLFKKAKYYQAEFVTRKSLLQSRGKDLNVSDFLKLKESELFLLKKGYESETKKISSIRTSQKIEKEMNLLKSQEFKNLLMKTFDDRKFYKAELKKILEDNSGPKINLRALILYESFASKKLDGATAHITYDYLNKKYPLKSIDKRNTTKYFKQLFIDKKNKGLENAVDMAIEYANFLKEYEVAESIENTYK